MQKKRLRPNDGLCAAALWLVFGLVGVSLSAVEPEADKPINLNLPAQIELNKLADIVSQTLHLSLEYNPQRVRGTVHLNLREQYTPAELWDVLNQVLNGAGFTTVLAGNPPLFQVVAHNEAAAVSQVIDVTAIDELLVKQRYRPGYLTLLMDLEHLSGEQAVAILGVLLGQNGQARTVDREGQGVLVAGPSLRVRTALEVVRRLDQPGLVPQFKQYRPQFATPAKLQGAVSAAWSAAGRLSGRNLQAEVQITPDTERLLIVASQDQMPEILALVRELDLSEPTTTETYRPQYFAIDDVASLIEQILETEEGGDRVTIVRDDLTESLIIRATEGQHRRVRHILDDLNQAPGAAKRVMRQFQIKHRPVEDLAAVLNDLLNQQAEFASELVESPAAAAVATTRPDVATPVTPADLPGGVSQAAPAETRAVSPAAAAEPSQAAPGVEVLQVGLSTDELTNTLVAFGPPRVLDQIEELISRLDAKQAQIELQITMVALSSSESFSLGVDLAGSKADGSLDGNIASLFGVSDPSNVGTTGRTMNNFTGLGGLVINPGDWAVTFNALETFNDGKTVVTTRIVIDNNAEASIDGVDQRPVSSTSANQSAAITGFGGTSDAGTQITVTPQIGAADQVTLDYTISQSSFVGESIQAGDGAVLPPPRRADTIASVATVPDGHVIALGGLVSARESKGQSGVPLLGRIPLLGMLFRRESSDEGESRFYVFIRANVLRHNNFEDLKYFSAAQRDQAGVDDGWPELTPRFLD